MQSNNQTASALPANWRLRATELRDWAAADGAARAWECAAKELETALQRGDDDLLTLGQAAKESGYSADHLGRELSRGKIPNAGRRNAPRIRRADLPRKPGALPARDSSEQFVDTRRIALAVVGSRREHNDE